MKLVINGNRVAFFFGGRGVGRGCKDFNKLVHMIIYIVLPPKRTDITNTDCSKLYLKIIHKLFFLRVFFLSLLQVSIVAIVILQVFCFFV